MFYVATGKSWFNWNIAAAGQASKRLLRMAAAKTFPLIANEFLWTMGTNVLFWSYARIDEYSLPHW
jgi:hypothetical protein